MPPPTSLRSSPLSSPRDAPTQPRFLFRPFNTIKVILLYYQMCSWYHLAHAVLERAPLPQQVPPPQQGPTPPLTPLPLPLPALPQLSFPLTAWALS